MSVRTYSRDSFLEARRLWETGAFSDEWEPYRRLAAERGFIYPPEGTQWDSWEDDEPSQRALLVRSMRETPKLLAGAIAVSSSWNEVLRRVLAGRDRMREDAMYATRDDGWSRRDELTPPEALRTLADIIGRIQDSRA